MATYSTAYASIGSYTSDEFLSYFTQAATWSAPSVITDSETAGQPGADTFETGDTLTVTGNISFTGEYVGSYGDGVLLYDGNEYLYLSNTPLAIAEMIYPDAYPFTPTTVCFAAGTLILTSLGQKPVEALRAGDLVATVSGRGAPFRPVLWIGRRRIRLAGSRHQEAMAPVRIRAGALGENTPSRDLLVSPDHCLFVDGVLVPARLLVNGRTITPEQHLAEITYYHVELDRHDVLLAEGAAAESWLDCGNRDWFENADTAQLLVDSGLNDAGSGWDSRRSGAPLLQGGDRLATIRAVIAARAAPDQDQLAA